MAPDSKLLIAENLIPDRVQKEDLYCYWIDLTMFTFAGKGAFFLFYRNHYYYHYYYYSTTTFFFFVYPILSYWILMAG